MAAYTTPATVIIPGKWTLTLGTAPGTDFSCDAAGVHLQSNAQTTTVAATLCQNGYDDVSDVRYALVLDFHAFWDEVTNLFQYLWDNSLTTQTFTFTGTNKATPPTTKWKMTGTVRIVSPPFDAVAGSVVAGSVTLPCIGKPVITAASATLFAEADAETTVDETTVPEAEPVPA
jgi:hypothetical protein